MNTSVSTAPICGDEKNFMNNMRSLVRNVQIFSQFRNPLPDGTMAKLEFMICCDSSKLNDNTVLKGIKALEPLPFNNFEMVLCCFCLVYLND